MLLQRLKRYSFCICLNGVKLGSPEFGQTLNKIANLRPNFVPGAGLLALSAAPGSRTTLAAAPDALAFTILMFAAKSVN